MRRTRTLLLFAAACLAVLAAVAAEALSNSADAFMSLPFGHPFNRTKLRMERSGATAKTQDGDYLSMEGLFEGRPALFVFSFHGRKGLKSKALYLQTVGREEDERLYTALMQAYNGRFGRTEERPLPNAWAEGKIMLRCIWTPDRWTSVALTYNPETAARFPGPSIKDRPIHLEYRYSRWD